VVVAEGEGRWCEYVGGYADWERVRKPTQEQKKNKIETKPASPATTTQVAATTNKPKKLSFKEQRELEELPKLIADLEREQTEIGTKLADPDLYRQDPSAMQKLNLRFAEIDSLLLQSLEKWEAIEARTKT
jgi:ATP-binding cassette subfamily F protein uup